MVPEGIKPIVSKHVAVFAEVFPSYRLQKLYEHLP